MIICFIFPGCKFLERRNFAFSSSGRSGWRKNEWKPKSQRYFGEKIGTWAADVSRSQDTFGRQLEIGTSNLFICLKTTVSPTPTNLQVANVQRCKCAPLYQLLDCTSVLFRLLYCKIKNVSFILFFYVLFVRKVLETYYSTVLDSRLCLLGT